MSYFLLSQAQAQVLHHEGNLTHVSFPSLMKESTRTRPFQMHHQGNLIHTIFHFIRKERTTTMPKTTKLHHDRKLTCAIFPYNTKTPALP